jgi:glycosyltransferase involved in cell wall biosynthesis
MEEAAKHENCRFGFVAMTRDYPVMIKEAAGYGFDGYWIPYDLKKRKRQMIQSFFKLYKLFRKIKPDVVHTHLFDDSVPSLLAARFAGIRVRVITKQDTAFHYCYAKKWMFFDKLNNFNATHVVPVSEEAKEFVIKHEKCNPKKVHVIHHGIDIARFSKPEKAEVEKFKEKYHLESTFVVGTIARFIKWKNYNEIIDIAEIVVKKIPEVRFLLIGVGDQMEEIKREVEKRNLSENVLFTGFIDKYYIQNVYAAMDIYLHTAFMEPFGFVIAEALAAGLPVISTPTGAAKDALTSKVNGWMGEYENSQSLVNGIEYFYNIKPEKPWLAAQKTAREKFDFILMYTNYVNLYISAINEKNP